MRHRAIERSLGAVETAWRCAIAALAVGAFVIGTPRGAAACSCMPVTDEGAIENSDAAFTGTLVDVVTPAGDTYSSTDPERFVFEVDDVYKGDVFARQTVVTARDGASCGLEISGPGPFLVFARRGSDGLTGGAVEGELYSSLCSGTRSLAGGGIPASFGTASPPAPGGSPEIDDRNDGAGISVVGVVGASLLLIGGGAVIATRRRKGTVTKSPAPS
jgi:hypothetical protein